MTLRPAVLLGAMLFASTALATHPVEPYALTQKTPAGATIAPGATVTGTTVHLSATHDGASCGGSLDYYKLEFEVRLVGQSFTNSATHSSTQTTNTSCVSTVYPNTAITLPGGSYKWQVRETINGSPSLWVQFNGGSTAFVLGGGASLAPTSLAFGTVRANTTSAPMTVDFNNAGSSAITVNSTNVTGPFSITNGPALPANVPAGGKVTFTLVAQPTTTGAATGSFTVNSSATNSPHTATLSVTGGLPQLVLNPATLNFGDVGINSAGSTQTVTVQNTGNVALNITGGTTAAPFTATGLGNLQVAAGGSATFTVNFAPTAQGAQTGTLSIASDDPNTPHALPLSGNGVEPKLTLSQTSLAFSDTVVGATSAPLQITLTNTGTGSLNIGAPVLSTHFTTTLTATTVAQGASTTFNLVFAPTAPGNLTGTLQIPSDDAAGPHTITLTGTATAPGLTVAPATHNFGSVGLGVSQTLVLTLTNPGDAALTVSSLALSGTHAADYQLVAPPSSPFTVPANGGTTQLTLKFAPTNVGVRSASLVINSNRYPAGPLNVSLSGTGDGPLVSVNPTSLTFGSINVGATGTASFNVGNSGNAALTVNGVTFSTGAAADFSTSQSTPFTVAPGQVSTVTVSFKPTVVGARASKATVITSDSLTPAIDVTLSGNGIAPNVSVTPLSLVFGKVRVEQTQTATLSITNTGTGPLNVSSLLFTGNDGARFSVSGLGAPFTLQPGAPAQQLQIAFKPTSVGLASAMLSLTSDDPDSPTLQIPLAGEGIAPGLAFSTNTLDFGGQVVNRTSAPRTVELSNNGTAPLQVFSMSPSGASGQSFSVISPSAPFTVPAGGKQVVSVTLTPKAIGEQTSRLLFQTDAPTGTMGYVDLVGLGISQVFMASPAVLDFGTVKAGSTSEAMTVTLTNAASDTLELKAAAIQGVNASDFNVVFTDASVAPGGQVVAKVFYKPANAGTHAAELHLGAVETQIPAVVVGLTGTSVSRIIESYPSSFDYGALPIGNSATQVFAVTNKTSKAVSIATVLSSSPDFTIDPASVGAIEPGKARNVTVTFTPSVAGPALSSLSVALEGQGAGQSELSIVVTGTGTEVAAKTGCAAAGGAIALWGALALVVPALLRRRRR